MGRQVSPPRHPLMQQAWLRPDTTRDFLEYSSTGGSLHLEAKLPQL